MEKVTTTMGVFMVNTVCTLKCRRCITLTPYQKSPENYPMERISKDIDCFFEIYDEIEHFDIEGGEPLLHPDLPEIIEKALEYKPYYKRLHILTNGTILPSEELLSVCRGNKDIFFIIDDYGSKLSKKAEEIKNVLRENEIDFRVDVYHGEDQYFGGWVDFGDLKHKNDSEEKIEEIFHHCRQPNAGAPYIKNGKMFLCSIQAAGIRHIPLKENEYIDFGSRQSIQEKKQIAADFGKKPIAACAYCQGFDAESGKRYPAAEQLEHALTEGERYAGN
jgi:organic radical activating enzyme